MALTASEQSGLIHGNDLQYLLNKMKGQFSDKTAFNDIAVDTTTNKFTLTRANGGTKDAVSQAAATQALAGLMSAADKTKLDGIATNANNYSLPLAASGTRGGVQVGYTTSGKVYAVQLSSEKMYVSVPWENNTWRGITTALNNTSTTVSASASAVKALNDNKADKSHGNHVPATQTASNKKFLRNDNTWQEVTPANIGAAASSHTHNYQSPIWIGSPYLGNNAAVNNATIQAGDTIGGWSNAPNDGWTTMFTIGNGTHAISFAYAWNNGTLYWRGYYGSWSAWKAV